MSIGLVIKEFKDRKVSSVRNITSIDHCLFFLHDIRFVYLFIYLISRIRIVDESFDVRKPFNFRLKIRFMMRAQIADCGSGWKDKARSEQRRSQKRPMGRCRGRE